MCMYIVYLCAGVHGGIDVCMEGLMCAWRD